MTVADEEVGPSGRVCWCLSGVEPDDTRAQADRLAGPAARLPGVCRPGWTHEPVGLTDIAGGLLLVPQFTLAADTRKGARPSFTRAAPPELGAELFDYLVLQARQRHENTSIGTLWRPYAGLAGQRRPGDLLARGQPPGFKGAQAWSFLMRGPGFGV